MNKADLGRWLRRVPVLGGMVGFFGMLGDVYDTIGWTDPSYHSIRSSQERLDEARRVGSIGDSAAPATEQAETNEGQALLPDLVPEQIDPPTDPTP